MDENVINSLFGCFELYSICIITRDSWFGIVNEQNLLINESNGPFQYLESGFEIVNEWNSLINDRVMVLWSVCKVVFDQ